jgi:hypothetical protein
MYDASYIGAVETYGPEYRENFPLFGFQLFTKNKPGQYN